MWDSNITSTVHFDLPDTVFRFSIFILDVYVQTCVYIVLSWIEDYFQSWNHSIGEVGREYSGSSGPTSPLKLGHPTAHGTGLQPDNSLICSVTKTAQ